jgi:predicted component of type VI protein secretion system
LALKTPFNPPWATRAGQETEPKPDGGIEFNQIGFTQMAERLAHQCARHGSYGTLGERRMNQARLAPEPNGKFSGSQRIAHRSHRHNQQVVGWIVRTDDDCRADFGR